VHWFNDNERKFPTDRKVKSYAIGWSKHRARQEKLPKTSTGGKHKLFCECNFLLTNPDVTE
jgi:hypothetical protein